MPERIEITYEVTLGAGDDIQRVSRDIALEQTVEVPEDCVADPGLWENVIGQVLAVAPLEGHASRFRVVIGYAPEITGFQIPQFLNIFFGNISLKNNIRIIDVTFPPAFLNRFPGPNAGSAGVRGWLGVYDRPLAATALKPMGVSPAALAAQARAFALGGGDLIKDDHGLADQPFCPFEERVSRCQEAVTEACAMTGRRTLYFPNVMGGHEQVLKQVEYAVRQGVRGVLISPFLVGPDLMRHLAQAYPVMLMAHPSFSGTHFHDRRHGMTPAVLLGKIFRLLGADISVFPNSGGRFGFTREECRELAAALKNEWGTLKPSLPAPAGGMQMENIGAMARQYGSEAVFLIGGALLRQAPDLQQGTRNFMEEIRRHFTERLETPAADLASACEWRPGESAGEAGLEYLEHSPGFTWKGRVRQAYKPGGDFEFAGIARQELTGRFGEKTRFDLRYFEIEPGGYSSLEKHVHEHVIIGARGQGLLVSGDRRQPLKVHDVAYVPPNRAHQLRNEGAEPFGFFCIVDHERDRPVKP